MSRNKTADWIQYPFLNDSLNHHMYLCTLLYMNFYILTIIKEIKLLFLEIYSNKFISNAVNHL